MEDIRKENIFQKLGNGVSALWKRLGEADIDDEDIELPAELNKKIEAEDMLLTKLKAHDKNDYHASNVEIGEIKKEKYKQSKTLDDDELTR